MSNSRHENYEILNLIGYGLAKFGLEFVRAFGFETKAAFYQHIVVKGIADSIGTVKNRQDLFDPFFDNRRKGWWQKGNTYLHRKTFIDSLFAECNVNEFANIVKIHIRDKFGVVDEALPTVSPITKSKFKQLQITGQEAELYFMENFQSIDLFKNGTLEDARFLGDGYDFQIEVDSRFLLAEVKGLRSNYGSIRLTENEFLKAKEYKDDYGLIVVSNLETLPKMTGFFDPISNLAFKKQKVKQVQISYHSASLIWQ